MESQIAENSIKSEEDRAVYANQKSALKTRLEKLIESYRAQHKKLERFVSLFVAQKNGFKKLREQMKLVRAKLNTFKLSHQRLKQNEKQQKYLVKKLQTENTKLKKQSLDNNDQICNREKENEFLKVFYKCIACTSWCL